MDPNFKAEPQDANGRTEVLPVLLSPLFKRSEDVFEYEKPTPTGESRNRMLATARW